MSYMADIGSYWDKNVNNSSNTNSTASANAANKKGPKVQTSEDRMGLDMTDFLTLMVVELQNQSIDETADTSDMLNQLVQMQMVQALVNMTDASVMSYASSLVGKEVTVAQYDSEGNMTEVVGTVTGTGTYNGNQVVFVGDKYYQLSEILAVGRLPEQPVEEPDTDNNADDENGGETTTSNPVE